MVVTGNVQAQAQNASKDLSTDKRKHPRFDVANRALLSVLGSKDSIPALVADISQAGLKLTADAGFPVGEIIRAEIEDEVFIGVVSYSKKAREGYQIGTEMLHSIKRNHLETLVREWGVPQ